MEYKKTSIEFEIRYVQEGEYTFCYIPGFDMHYSMKGGDEELIKKRGRNMMNAFIRFAKEYDYKKDIR
jgi:hypothetical protein